MRRFTGIAAAAGGASIALQALSAAGQAGGDVPAPAFAAGAAATAALAIAASLQTAWFAWRGPRIESLPEDDLTVVGPPEAETIRAAAQLRGTLGGAGHVHRHRLALPFGAWASAAGTALAGPDAYDAVLWVMLLGVFVAAALAFPAKAFFYREATGGRVVVYPAAAGGELLRSGGDAATVRRERAP